MRIYLNHRIKLSEGETMTNKSKSDATEPFAEARGSATERVPQYDVELRLADEAVREWMAMAARLKSVVGCRATEKRRAAAEMAYDNLLRKYERPWLKGVLADAVKAKQQWPE